MALPADLMPPTLPDGRRLAYEMEERPRVSAHEGAPISELLRRRMAEARKVLREGPCAATCPASMLIGDTRGDGLVVRCGVERSLITERESPSSLARFCLGSYTECPTWREEKEREWHGKRAPLVPVSEGV